MNAVRRDIADVALAESIFAPHYALPDVEGLILASAMIRCSPDDMAEASSQLLRGEIFAVLDISGDWAWGYSGHDHYVGYVRRDALGLAAPASHVVIAREAPIFAAADIKSAVRDTLTLGARVSGIVDDGFLRIADGYLHLRHVRDADHISSDPVSVAEQFLGAPYLWGGRGAGGIDCSGLVQLALGMAGIACPRDTDLQRMALGEDIGEGEALRRGDLVFFPGHVGLMTDSSNMIHANAFWMNVSIEPLDDVVDRLRPKYDTPVLARRRIGE